MATTFQQTIYLILYGWLLLALVTALITDLRRHRVPNLVTLPTIALALLVHLLLGGWPGLLFSLQGLGLGFACFLPAYLLGGMGAGDVKLMSGVGAVLGFQQTLVALLFIAVTGGLLALGLMLQRRTLAGTLARLGRALLFLGLHRDASLLRVDKDELAREGMPFAVAIAGGVLLYLLYLWRTTGLLVLPAPS